MGQCLGTPSPPRDSSAAAQKASVTNVSQVSADQTAKPPDAAPPSVVPVGSTASVSIMPPWASHGEIEGNNRPCLVRPTPTTPASDPATTALRSNLSEVKSVLQQLTAMNPNPTIGLAEAAEMLCKHLGVSLVSIVACTEGLESYILLASYGAGAIELERFVVMQGTDWAPFLLDSHTSHIYYSVENDEQALPLPKYWEALYRLAGIRSFMAVPIGGAGEVLGLLTIAKHAPGAFNDEWWEPMLGVLAVGLLPQLRNEQVGYLCHLVRVLHSTDDHLALVALLLQGAHRLLLKTTNIKMGVRLGLLNDDASKALIFEIDSAKIKDSDYLTTPTREAMADITITEIGTDNTLLLDAINKGKARFVSDCASYLQSCMKPATDIFISSQQMVASIVVLPLTYGTQNLGGLYFTLETPSNFQNIKDMLMGFVNSIVLVLVQKLEGQLHQIWDVVLKRPLLNGAAGSSTGGGNDSLAEPPQLPPVPYGLVALPASGTAGPAAAAAAAGQGGTAAPIMPVGAPIIHIGAATAVVPGDVPGADAAAVAAAPVLQQAQPAAAAAATMGGGSVHGGVEGAALGTLAAGDTGPSGNVNKKLFVKRSCTEAMLKVLQHEIRKTHARNQTIEWLEDLVLMETIGKGGFGVVYKGSWKGSLAAIKVMYARQHERQAMKDALEMAVLTSVSHPNIIQVYSCFTDMVEDAGSTPGLGEQPPESRINVRFRRLEPDEDRSMATCNIVVMEYCDKGSLRHAIKRGVFHKRLSSTSVAVDLCAIVQVLMEVAASVQHLHNMQLLHCDIKPENVLLKSDSANSLGFTTKLSDFGLAKLLRDNYYIINRSGSGTITHLAPELFQVGSKITTAVDTFSFGIMMWELYTGQRAYSGLDRDAIIDRVYKKQSRPVFPSGVPAPYSQLACSCWEVDVLLRPSFATIRTRLQEMLMAFQSGAYAGAGAAAEAVRERLAATMASTGVQQQQLQQLQQEQLEVLQAQLALQQQQAAVQQAQLAAAAAAAQQAQAVQVQAGLLPAGSQTVFSNGHNSSAAGHQMSAAQAALQLQQAQQAQLQAQAQLLQAQHAHAAATAAAAAQQQQQLLLLLQQQQQKKQQSEGHDGAGMNDSSAAVPQQEATAAAPVAQLAATPSGMAAPALLTAQLEQMQWLAQQQEYAAQLHQAGIASAAAAAAAAAAAGSSDQHSTTQPRNQAATAVLAASEPAAAAAVIAAGSAAVDAVQ